MSEHALLIGMSSSKRILWSCSCGRWRGRTGDWGVRHAMDSHRDHVRAELEKTDGRKTPRE